MDGLEDCEGFVSEGKRRRKIAEFLAEEEEGYWAGSHARSGVLSRWQKVDKEEATSGFNRAGNGATRDVEFESTGAWQLELIGEESGEATGN